MSHPVLTTRGATMSQRPFPPFGSYHDNESASRIAMYEIEHSNTGWGYAVFERLRDHIYRTGEPTSMQWILPKVLEILTVSTASIG